MRSRRSVGTCNSGTPIGIPPNADRELEQRDRRRREDERDDRARHPGHHAGDEQRGGERGAGQPNRDAIRGRERISDDGEPRQKVGRHDLDRQAEQVFDLRRGDEHGDAVGEADHHGTGDELHRPPQSRQGEDDEQEARQQGDRPQPRNAVLTNDGRDDYDERARRASDLHSRAAQERHERATDDRGVDAGLRRYAGGDTERHR
jgi:hypothetical protein